MHSRKSFTLVEMLIVIVIIGILAAALIPRITGTQARARDVARESDLRDLSNAVTMYSIDHDGGYPPAFNNYGSLPSKQLTASTGPMIYTPDRLLAAIPAGAEEGTVEVLGDNLSTYISGLPEDPAGKGIGAKSHTDKDCEEKGPSYAYYSNAAGDMYAITAKMEKAKGNTNNCGGLVDTRDGAYKTAGEGIITQISTVDKLTDPVGWCKDNLNDDALNELNYVFNDTKSADEWCALDQLVPTSLSGGAVPDALMYLANLTYIEFRGLTTDSVTIRDMPNLEGLNIGGSKNVESIILNDLPSLSFLWIIGNGLDSLPQQTCDLINSKGRSSPSSAGDYQDYGQWPEGATENYGMYNPQLCN